MSQSNFQLQDTFMLLLRTPKVLRLMLEGLPHHWIHSNEGENTWSPFDVLGHLIHGEQTDWVPRIRIIKKIGPEKQFIAFDRFAHLQANKHRSLDQLLNEFEIIRTENVAIVKELIDSEKDLTLTGKHPDLGIVTLQELLATWTVHDLNHIGQIARVMSKYYKDDVGPWKTYLGILQA